jgi:hypothetical protein
VKASKPAVASRFFLSKEGVGEQIWRRVFRFKRIEVTKN